VKRMNKDLPTVHQYNRPTLDMLEVMIHNSTLCPVEQLEKITRPFTGSVCHLLGRYAIYWVGMPFTGSVCLSPMCFDYRL